MQTQQHSYTDVQIEQLSRQWVETMVVGLNLCPFAAPVVRKETLRYALSRAADEAALSQWFLDELMLISEAPDTEIATSLLMMPAVTDFYDYLDLLDHFERLLKRAGLEGIFQLASFHPQYLFGGVDPDDLSHWTNRSPFPMVHIIREGQMERVLASYKDPDAIPERNMQLMRDLGKAGLIETFPPLADYWQD